MAGDRRRPATTSRRVPVAKRAPRPASPSSRRCPTSCGPGSSSPRRARATPSDEPVVDEGPSVKDPAPKASQSASSGGRRLDGVLRGVGGGVNKATALSNGVALPPFEAPEAVHQIIEAGNSIARTPYKWGGGHGKWQDTGYDCSGSVSFALAAAGLLEGPLASGPLMSWGERGPASGSRSTPTRGTCTSWWRASGSTPPARRSRDRAGRTTCAPTPGSSRGIPPGSKSRLGCRPHRRRLKRADEGIAA